MTGRTHDLAAFTALNWVITSQPLPVVSLATTLVALGANLLGGIAPDADQPTGSLWQKFPAGTIVGRIVHPFIGRHRHLSHSLLGLVLAGWLTGFLLKKIHTVLLVDMDVVWWTFLIGYTSHLVMDSFTTEGVPWLFPLPWKLGFPPFSALRIATGGIIERLLVFPALLVYNGYLFYHHYPLYLSFLRSLLTK